MAMIRHRVEAVVVMALVLSAGWPVSATTEEETQTATVGVLEVTRVLAQSSMATVVEGEAAEGDTLTLIP